MPKERLLQNGTFGPRQRPHSFNPDGSFPVRWLGWGQRLHAGGKRESPKLPRAWSGPFTPYRFDPPGRAKSESRGLRQVTGTGLRGRSGHCSRPARLTRRLTSSCVSHSSISADSTRRAINSWQAGSKSWLTRSHLPAAENRAPDVWDVLKRPETSLKRPMRPDSLVAMNSTEPDGLGAVLAAPPRTATPRLMGWRRADGATTLSACAHPGAQRAARPGRDAAGVEAVPRQVAALVELRRVAGAASEKAHGPGAERVTPCLPLLF